MWGLKHYGDLLKRTIKRVVRRFSDKTGEILTLLGTYRLIVAADVRNSNDRLVVLPPLYFMGHVPFHDFFRIFVLSKRDFYR